jgi:hypothetical protein
MPVIPLQYAPASESAADADHRLRWWVVAAWLACAIAWVLIIAVDVESVIVSGPVIFLIGGWILYRAIRLRSPAHAVLGSTHCAICMLFVMLVQLR